MKTPLLSSCPEQKQRHLEGRRDGNFAAEVASKPIMSPVSHPENGHAPALEGSCVHIEPGPVLPSCTSQSGEQALVQYSVEQVRGTKGYKTKNPCKTSQQKRICSSVRHKILSNNLVFTWNPPASGSRETISKNKHQTSPHTQDKEKGSTCVLSL